MSTINIQELVLNINARDNASAAMNKVGISAKQLVGKFATLATGVFSLYNSFERVNDANLRVEKSNLAVKRATETLNDATKKHTEALNESKSFTDKVADAQKNLESVQNDGTSSAEDIADAQQKLNDALADLDENKEAITGAVKDIEIAEDSLKVKTEYAEDAQRNLQTSIITAGVQAPLAVAAIASTVWDLKTALDAANTSAGASGLLGTVGKLKSVGAMIIPVTIVIGVAWAITEGIKWIKENIIYPSAPDMKKWEQFQATYPELFPRGIATPKGLVPGMQKGGIVTEPMFARLGEAGPEAVIPLNEGIGSSIVQNFYFTVDSWTDLSKVREVAAEGASLGISESLRRRGR